MNQAEDLNPNTNKVQLKIEEVGEMDMELRVEMHVNVWEGVNARNTGGIPRDWKKAKTDLRPHIY